MKNDKSGRNERFTVKNRFKYWFDNKMTRGSWGAAESTPSSFLILSGSFPYCAKKPRGLQILKKSYPPLSEAPHLPVPA